MAGLALITSGCMARSPKNSPAGRSTCAAAKALRISVHRITFPVNRTVRIVHLTDLHIGWGAPLCLVQSAVERARRARPHLTVLTGDYINHLHHLKDLSRVVRQLPRPCLATLGNHDHQTGARKIAAVFARAKIPVLTNEIRVLKLNGQKLYVVGIDDNITRHHDVPRAMAQLPSGQRALVLSHAPSIADVVARHHKGRHLILVGHTHGGQIYVPYLSPAIARLGGARYLAGFYSVKGNRMYVNAGIGDATIRRRVGHRARREVAIFDLVPE